jgi:hypothetical protein
MALNIERELAALRRMSPKTLQERYAEVFGEEPRNRNREWLTKRITWRLQANEEGDLSERARRRATELANDSDLRTTAPRSPRVAPGAAGRTKTVPIQTDTRLPMPETLITREYKGQMLQVKVRDDGFEYEGQVYKSLTAVAHAVTGAHWNGYHFFGLKRPGGRQ